MMQLEEYLEAHLSPIPAELEALERRTQLRLYNPRMCSGRLQGRLLKMLASLMKPRLALELGTYSAYSTLCIAEGMEAGGRLHTIEANDELQDFISTALQNSAHGSKVIPHFGKALELIPQIAYGQKFDFVFIDADKREYPQYYKLLRPRMNTGGLIIADNTLWDGHVLEADRSDAQTLGIKQFNDMVAADSSVEALILPLRDGLSILRCT